MAPHAAKIEQTGITGDGSKEAAMNVEECRGSWLEIRLGFVAITTSELVGQLT
jgi:hypothetical protein